VIAAVKATLRIADQELEKSVPPNAKEVVFKMRLAAGVTRMSARFYTDDGQEFGAYYAYVKRL
jgi:hypothetical protein